MYFVSGFSIWTGADIIERVKAESMCKVCNASILPASKPRTSMDHVRPMMSFSSWDHLEAREAREHEVTELSSEARCDI